MTLELILCCGLSTLVLLVMLKDLDGPFDIFLKLRYALCRYAEEDGVPSNFFAKLFDCPWCLSTWISAFVATISVMLFGLWWPIFFYLWLSSIAIALVIYLAVLGL